MAQAGTCTPAAGALTCVSKVCDTKDNECGYANGDGPCTASEPSVAAVFTCETVHGPSVNTGAARTRPAGSVTWVIPIFFPINPVSIGPTRA